MNAAVSLMDGLGLDGDRCICVIPQQPPRAIQLTVKYPSFNWEGNTHEQFKTFKQRTEIPMEGPYEDYKEPDKVAAILGWLGDKGHQVYASLDLTA